jgi:hypothetical protein
MGSLFIVCPYNIRSVLFFESRWVPKMGCWPLWNIKLQRIKDLNNQRNTILSNGITSLGKTVALGGYSWRRCRAQQSRASRTGPGCPCRQRDHLPDSFQVTLSSNKWVLFLCLSLSAASLIPHGLKWWRSTFLSSIQAISLLGTLLLPSLQILPQC